MKFLLFAAVFILSHTALAQATKGSRVNLEDIEIKGEAHNDGRVDLLRRDRNDIADIIEVRRDFRPEILRSIPSYFRDLDSEK